MIRRLSPALFALTRLPWGVVGLASCCLNSTSGADFVDECVCLVDNTPLPGQTLGAGESRIYHWVLSLDNSELVSGPVRGNLTFEVAPCNGSVSMEIKSGSPGSWQLLPSFNSSDDYNVVSVTIPAKFTEQIFYVTAGSVDTTFDIVVLTTLYDRPMPGNGGVLEAEMITAGTARVLINTTDTEAAGDVMYSLYWSSLPEADDGGCTAASENVTLRENPNCLFWSTCGLENAAEGRTDWVVIEPNTIHAFEVAVQDDSSYLFNVAMMDSRNITSVYAGSNVSFTATDYQDCVADPNCKSQLNDDSTIIAIAAVALAALALLIAGMKLLHTSIAKVMRETVSARSVYLGRTRAMFGKKRDHKGKIFMDSFYGLDNDETPVPTPDKRYDGDSAYFKAVPLKEEDSAEAEVPANPSKPKSPERASPGRRSVVSPRSRSKYREDREGDNGGDDGGRSANRSAAASPRSRNRRGGGGGGDGGKEKGQDDENPDDERTPPPPDPGTDGEGKHWQTPGSRRVSAVGTRTHKSQRSSPRRQVSYAEEDEGRGRGGEGEGRGGASPRDRSTARTGDPEQEERGQTDAAEQQSSRRRRRADLEQSARARRRTKQELE